MLKGALTCSLVILVMVLGSGQETKGLIDLKNQWTVFTDDNYKQFDAGVHAEAIHLFLRNIKQSGKLSVHSAREYFVFINGKLSGKYQQNLLLNIDSLQRVYKYRDVQLTIYQPHLNPDELTTTVRSLDKIDNLAVEKRANYFKDFVIVAGLLIITLFVMMMRLNPKLSNDYLSIAKMFSLREGDDAQSNARLTSSSNIQFYALTSMLLSFFLMLVFNHLPTDYSLATSLATHSFASAFGVWLIVSAIIFVLFTFKIIVIFSITRLFGLKGLAHIHYFNWIRLLLIIFGVASLLVFVYFISRGLSTSFFENVLISVVVVLVAWTFVVFLKLNNKSDHTMFHLFSYICATEIIPLLITIKVLFQ